MPEEVCVVSVLKEGWLEKRSRHLGIWRKRWVVLTGEGLVTFKRPPNASSTTRRLPGRTEMMLITSGLKAKAASALNYDRMNLLELHCDGRVVFPFVAETWRERDEWVKAINSCSPSTSRVSDLDKDLHKDPDESTDLDAETCNPTAKSQNAIDQTTNVDSDTETESNCAIDESTIISSIAQRC